MLKKSEIRFSTTTQPGYVCYSGSVPHTAVSVRHVVSPVTASRRRTPSPKPDLLQELHHGVTWPGADQKNY
jgi:hypothetical protein